MTHLFVVFSDGRIEQGHRMPELDACVIKSNWTVKSKLTVETKADGDMCR